MITNCYFRTIIQLCIYEQSIKTGKVMRRVLFLIVLIFVIGVIIGCDSNEVVQVEKPTATAIVYPTPMNDPTEVAEIVERIKSGEKVVAEEPEPVAQDEGGEEEATVEPSVDYCVQCHTDKEQLINTAKPEEVHEAENEGEG
jgi:hypothetical protein